ncbi:hypothetical protein [Variovorax sp. WS11]|uniref:hypothetical protein n=1 Tax=Variovorax sp. WS11 TaxID=1105204 RepID=UPI0011B21900|nr:hypothetical protein [Variovorax sp. WS11]NDZ17120.1 hypothetical protein [Variovorax sp. WS11]
MAMSGKWSVTGDEEQELIDWPANRPGQWRVYNAGPNDAYVLYRDPDGTEKAHKVKADTSFDIFGTKLRVTCKSGGNVSTKASGTYDTV